MKRLRKQTGFRSGERGQASLEFAVMLIGFGMLLLGMIFLCAVAYDNNGILLDAKYRAESGLGSGDSGTGFTSGKEISTWDYTEIDLFSNGSTIVIPFTPSDKSRHSADNSIGSVGNDFADDSVSEPTPRRARTKNGEKEFTYEYKWLSPGGFASDLNSDYTDDLNSGKNALDAAMLFRGSSAEKHSDTMEQFFRNAPRSSGVYSYGRTYDWFGLRIKQTDLSDSPTNQVYMPKR